MLLPQQPSVYLYNYILLPYNHAATPTTKSLPLQLHTATLQPCCYPNNQVPTFTTTYCYPTTMLLYPNNQVPTLLLPYNHADTPTTKSLPLQLHTAIPYNHAATPTTKSLPLQLHTATLQPCCYLNNQLQVPTLTTIHTDILQPCCYTNNQVPTLPYNHAATPRTMPLVQQAP